MSPRAVRIVVFAVCAAGIAGMVAGSIADDNAVALTFGLITAAAVACLIVATAVAGSSGVTGDDEALGERVEAGVAALVGAGADEAAVRTLVREAVRLGESRQGDRKLQGRGWGARRTHPTPRRPDTPMTGTATSTEPRLE